MLCLTWCYNCSLIGIRLVSVVIVKINDNCITIYYISSLRLEYAMCLSAGADPEVEIGGGHMASAEHEPIMGVWGLCPQRGPGAEPLVRGSKPPEAERFLVLSYVWNGAKLLCLWAVLWSLMVAAVPTRVRGSWVLIFHPWFGGGMARGPPFGSAPACQWRRAKVNLGGSMSTRPFQVLSKLEHKIRLTGKVEAERCVSKTKYS